MKKVVMFSMASCPHCQRALQWMSQVTSENPAYRAVHVEIIDEVEHPDVAEKYDYYYVPTYYVGGAKVHEGVASKQIIESVFAMAAEGEAVRAAGFAGE